jgi:hypothetical protein
MTKKELVSEFIGYGLLIVFTIGWMDFGQGPDLTWWKLIHVMGN